MRQHDRSDCGAACLAGIATYYGKSLSVARVRILAGTDASGTSLSDLQRAALKLGFHAEPVQGDYAGLGQASLPAILHLDHADTGAHFVVVTRTGHRTVTVLDPADGRRHRWPIAQLNTYWSGAALLLIPGPAFLMDGRHKPAPSTGRRMVQLLLPYRRYLAIAFLLALLVTGLATAGAFFIGLLTDHIVPSQPVGTLHSLGFVFVLALLLQVALSTLRKSITLHTARLIDSHLLRTYCKHLLQLPQQVFNGMQTGELLSRMGDAVLIRRMANDLLIQSGVPALSLAAVLIVALARHPAMALWLVLSVAAYAGIYAVSNVLQRILQSRLLVSEAALDARFTETFGNIGTIKQLGAERTMGQRLDACIYDFLAATHAAGRVSLWVEEATSLFAQGFSLALLWGGGALVLGGRLSLGELVAFYTISGYFSAAAAQLMPLARHAQEARLAADRLYGLLDIPPAEPLGATHFDAEDLFPLMLDHVQFGYGRGVDTLRDISMTLLPGTIILVRGVSGSGKSTLLSLLLRQYIPTGGQIHCGIHPLSLIDRDALNRHIAAVPQRIQLFDDTFVANICLGEKPDLGRLKTVCHELGLLPLIHSLPQQFDTPLGPDGCLLSGGQRQLVALARALYRQPQLLLLDEATSALDAATEARVHQALLCRKAMGMAILWISHGDACLSLADTVYQLVDGQLIPYPDRSTPAGAAAATIPDHGVAASARNHTDTR